MSLRSRMALTCLIGLAFGWLGALPQTVSSQEQTAREISKVERLGYPAGTKLLIIHADDIGVSHSENRATFAAYESGGITSGSILVPCPWVPEAAAFFREHPQFDVGIHLTLTAEWKHLRWPALSSRSEAPSLFDAQGFLYNSVAEVRERVDPGQAERELRAQVARAKALGINPSHVDTHMAAVLASKQLFEAYLRVAKDFGIPAMIPFQELKRSLPAYVSGVQPDQALIDRIIIAPGGLKAEEWGGFYTKAIEGLQPGITEIIVHLAYDDEEMRAVTVDHPDYGAAWRQRDFDFFTSQKAKDLLANNQVRLTTWREIGKLLPR